MKALILLQITAGLNFMTCKEVCTEQKRERLALLGSLRFGANFRSETLKWVLSVQENVVGDEICLFNLRNYLCKWYTEVDNMCIINILAKLIHQTDAFVITVIVHNTVDRVMCFEIFIIDLRTSSMPYKLNDWWCWNVRRNSESFDFAFCRRVPSSRSGNLLSISATGIISLLLNCYALRAFAKLAITLKNLRKIVKLLGWTTRRH